VTLFNGEEAEAVPLRYEETDGGVVGGYAVITRTTLIWVVGRVAKEDITRLASQLRPTK
jgi:hypothetical protein